MTVNQIQNHFVRLLFCFVLCCFGINSGVAQEQQSSVENESKTATIEKIIANLNTEISELSKNLPTVSGEEHDAIQLRLYHKNEALRDNISKAIDGELLDPSTLSTMVKNQLKYTNSAIIYIAKKVNTNVKNIDKAALEDKLGMLASYRELQEFLDLMYQWSWQNEHWLMQMGIEPALSRTKLAEKFVNRMNVLSASVEYFDQQKHSVQLQLSQSPESEKAALQIKQLVVKQRLEIAIDSLSALSKIAEKMGVETASYRQLIFETTGNITVDILDADVLWAIALQAGESALKWLGNSAPQFFFQIFLLILVLLVANALAKLTRKIVSRTVTTKNLNLSQLMQDFFVSMSGKMVWVIGILIGLAQIGLDLAPVLTGFGIAGIIIGLALQDSLSNLAAGMMLLIYRPFDVGDFVHAGGVDGKVCHMSLVNTTIRTFDNQIIIVPNNKIWGDVIKNVTHERTRRVDMVFGIGYGDDLLKAEKVLNDIIAQHEKILETPEPNIKVHTLNTSSVDFIVRPWVQTEDYWDVYWDITKEVKLRFDKEGISIPFPQQDVHLHMTKQPRSELEEGQA